MKTVFITGANKGLGLALTQVFLQEGWRVLAACRNPKDMTLAAENLELIELDVANQDHINRLSGKLGGRSIDVLINNAGVYDTAADSDLLFTSLQDITNVFVVNTIAPRLIAEALVGSLKKGEGKLIVTISSDMGIVALADTYHAEHWSYSGSKAALNWEMATFSKVYPEITSVMINPGWMKTVIGGDDAPLEPAESAADLYRLVEEHKLKDGNHYDRKGAITKL